MTELHGFGHTGQQSVSTEAARLLANTTKSAPQYIGSGPRWLVSLLPWLALEAGTFRINRLKVAAPPPRLVEVNDSGASSSVSAGSVRAGPALRPWLARGAATVRISRLKVAAPPPRLVEVNDSGASSSVSAGSLRAVPALR